MKVSKTLLVFTVSLIFAQFLSVSLVGEEIKVSENAASGGLVNPAETFTDLEGVGNEHNNLVAVLLNAAQMGSTWVLWLLIGLSVLSLSIIFERIFYFYRKSLNFDKFMSTLSEYLQSKETTKAKEYCRHLEAFEGQLAFQAIDSAASGVNAMEKGMLGFIARERSRMDKGLTFLGTLGNNAPFIGLFGTVLGVIQAFKDLSVNPAGGPAVVMGGISEALVSTAVGLFVAIPAVIAFNWFQRKIVQRMNNAEAIQNLILKHYS